LVSPIFPTSAAFKHPSGNLKMAAGGKGNALSVY